MRNPNGFYHRLPLDVAEATSEGVRALNHHTAGGRVRFKTTSSYVVVNARVGQDSGKMAHMTVVGASGFDMYLVENGKEVFFRSFIPDFNFGEKLERIIEFPDNTMRDIVINFPTYNSCADFYIGLQASAEICPSPAYTHEKPIVFYGSSITQGGCASRPGNTYEGKVCRHFDSNHTNLGFSGSCRGEQAMCDYLPTLDMSIFVYDYDHNAPSAEHLEATHEKLFMQFRKSHPHTPVIIMSMTDIPRLPADVIRLAHRRDIVRRTYENAIAAGDKNVYFIDGQDIFKLAGSPEKAADCTVDGCHPNDLGFHFMAEALIKVIEENDLLNKVK